MDCRDVYALIPNNPPPFPAKDLLVLSNGYCGSTCALFTNTVHVQHNVKTIVIGGPSASLAGYGGMAYSSFVGGQSFSLDSVREEAWLLNITSKAVPEALPTRSVLAFTIREVYSFQDSNVPQEFVFLPADEQVPNLEEFDGNPVALWRFVHNKFL